MHDAAMRPRLALGIAAGLATGFALLTGCATREPLPTVAHVDLARMEGTWHIITHIPNWLEEGKVATADRYRLRPDGQIDSSFVFRRGSFDAPEEEWQGIAWVEDRSSNAHWQVRFLWPFAIDYLVIDLDPEYRWLAVGHPSRDWFWILARERRLDPDVRAGIIARATALGYDPTRFADVPQP
jgi:apolipoprotein D and lipocalin family protein